MLSIASWIEKEETELKDLFSAKNIQSDIAAVKQAYSISTGVLNWAKSTEGVTIEQLIEKVLPKSASWIVEGTAVLTTLASDMAAVGSPMGLTAIAQRLGAEILSLIDGGKLPTGIAGYIAEFQQIFLG